MMRKLPIKTRIVKQRIIFQIKIPTRQLKWLAKRNDNWRLDYEQGGIGTYNVYIERKIKKDSLFKLEDIEKYIDTNN